MEQTNNQELVGCITKCFELSMDGNLSPEERKIMLAQGKRLRGNLLNLLSVAFNNAAAVDEANGQITEINTALAATIADISHLADTVEKINGLVDKLDKILLFAIAIGL